MEDLIGARIQIVGVVQGVGFRPFIYGLAQRFDMKGWVRNTSAGVEIQVEGTQEDFNKFVNAINNDAPPLAQIDDIKITTGNISGYTAFEIHHSQAIQQAFQPISPDVSICPDCLRELFDPNDRRYQYPFINCTNCGPRFTIIKDIPYDRPNTTMVDFPICDDCAKEYHDPLDRRFHAQPIACPTCGPSVWLEIPSEPYRGDIRSNQAINQAKKLLALGKILAVKGLGGFHLACDALNDHAVNELRRRKLRVDKPFALMALDSNDVRWHCYLDFRAQELLESRERPIVILDRRSESNISRAVAPKQDTIGIMLPYTPLHYLLLMPSDNNSDKSQSPILVMTSANLSEEPILIDNEQARIHLGNIADAFLMHDRPIHTRCDDSVIIINTDQTKNKQVKPENLTAAPKKSARSNWNGYASIVRRSRGYAPAPINLPWDSPPLLATGAELKNTFCLTRDRYAFMSQHIGDLQNYETLMAFENGINHMEHIFRLQPILIAHDMHPDYLSTRYAQKRSERDQIASLSIQHHHAHIAACMAENRINDPEPVIGVAFDGTGFGVDGAIWGGEFLLCRYQNFQRVGNFKYIPLPGGDAAIHRPARIALAYLWDAGIEWTQNLACVADLSIKEQSVIRSQLENHVNAPMTSSAGRLFDAISSIVGICHTINYEAQAAIELEAITDRSEKGSYEYQIVEISQQYRNNQRKIHLIDPGTIVKEVILDIQRNTLPSAIAAKFHNTIALIVTDMCSIIHDQVGIDRVVLSGGVWQNKTLFRTTTKLLNKNGFSTYVHRKVPTNDGGISFGQAVIASKINQ